MLSKLESHTSGLVSGFGGGIRTLCCILDLQRLVARYGEAESWRRTVMVGCRLVVGVSWTSEDAILS